MEFLKKLGKTKLIVLALASLLMVVAITALVINLSKPPMVPIYNKLSPDDSTAVITKLQNLNIAHDIDSQNNQILVPVDKVLGLRMSFAQDGIPHSNESVGYEIFDKSDIVGTSQFVNNVNLVRALEGELSRTIASLNPIESARVHVVMPRTDLFSKVGPIPSASVVVKTKPGQKLTKEEINGIAHLLVTAIPDLKLDNVTILNQKGTPLKIGDDNQEEIYDDKIENYRSYVEDRLNKSIENLLSKYVGYGNVKSNVTANIDFNREVINTEVYNPEGQVVRSQKTSKQNEKDGPEKDDNVSVATNLPNTPQQINGNNNTKTLSKTDEIINYEISKSISNKVIHWGSITKLSVAVLVDGIYNVDKATGNKVYEARTEKDLEQMKALVSAAIGIDSSRGDTIELVSVPFDRSDVDLTNNNNESQYSSKNLTQFIIIGTIILLALLLLLRPFINKLIAKKKNGELNLEEKLEENMSQSLKNQNAQGSDINNSDVSSSEDKLGLSRFNEKKYADLMNYLNSTVEKSPNDATIVLRNWLYQEEK